MNIEGCTAISWSPYGFGATIGKLPFVLNWEDAVSNCRDNYSIVASPFDNTLAAAVIQLSMTAKLTAFWTGLRRNNPDGTWIGDLYHASNESFKWKSGYTGEEVGDCLAMEVLPIGITFYPEDCGVSLNVICDRFRATHPTRSNSQTALGVPDYHGIQYNVTSFDCPRICVMDRNCTGYSFNNTAGICYTFDSASFDNKTFPPNIVSTEWNTTVCNIVDCMCTLYGWCAIDACYIDKASNCTFDDCLDNVTCQQFAGSVCALNGTNVYINCTTFNGTIFYEATTEAPIPVSISYRSVIGCILQFDPDGGMLVGNISNRFNSKSEVSCSWPYISWPNATITCKNDRRWDSIPYCWIPGPPCSLGWYEQDGICYQIQSGQSVSWFDQPCDVDNAFSLYIETWNEALFVDKLLYYHQNETFWIGGANLNTRNVSRFYWKHAHTDIDVLQWANGTTFTENMCVSLRYVGGKFRYEAVNCMNQYAYVCKKGRIWIGGDCGGDEMCVGNSKCIMSQCRCVGLKLYGAISDDPYAYCGNTKVTVQNSMLTKLAPKPWELAAAECANLGGSILTVLTKNWEDIMFTNFGYSGYDIRHWTGFYFQNGALQMQGVIEYEVQNLTQIPWRSTINATWTTMSFYGCVYQRTSALGVRYYVQDCETQTTAICQVDYSSYFGTNQNNQNNIPFKVYQSVTTVDECSLKCRYDKNCLSLSYYPGNNTCRLYNTKSPGSNQDAPNLHMYKNACVQPSDPRFGMTNPGPNTIGSSIQFSCDSGYKIPIGYSNSMSCTNQGFWNNIPKCVFNGPQCNQGWEQVNMSCYLVQEYLVTWDAASLDCVNNGGTLLETYSNAEMSALAKILDHIGKSHYWTGGNCRIMNGYYSWFSNPYSQISFYKWYDGQPTRLYDCMVVQRIFGYNDTKQLFFADEDCSLTVTASGVLTKNPYVCKKNLLNVGSANCSIFGADPCKVNSECLNDKCVCKEFFHQLGLDNLDTTACNPIRTIGDGPCYSLNDFCMNNSTCVNNVCRCPTNLIQNGPDKSLASVCQSEPVRCATSWVQHQGHCYTLTNYPVPMSNTFFVYNLDNPIVYCGMLKAYMAVIHDAETNEVVRKLGTGYSYRYIGLIDEFLNEDLIWIGDESEPAYTRFEFENKTAMIGYLMNPIGYWIKETYTLNPGVGAVNLPKNQIVCEKPQLCSSIPVISNAVIPPSNIVGEDVGKEYIYTCNYGFVMAGLGYPFIKCRESNRISQWDNSPQCKSLLQEKYIDVSNTLVMGTSLSTLFTVTNNIECATNCFFNKSCEAFYYNDGTKQCSLYDLRSNLNTIPTASSQIWKTAMCDPIPFVNYATFNATGRNFGDKVTYACASNYRIDRNTSATLTCLPTGRWDYNPPQCKARFTHRTGAVYNLCGQGRNKIYHNIFTVDDCEIKCTLETRFRCMTSVLRSGTCMLWNKLPISCRDQIYYDEAVIGGQTSELQDSDVDLYDMWYGTRITSGGVFLGVNKSYEICAQRCSNHVNNCTGFDYNPVNTTCYLHFDADVSSNMTTDTIYNSFKRRYVCNAPPILPGITYIELVRQNPGLYQIGDLLQAKCNNFGEEIVADHSGLVECLATGMWTPRLPACKNLCETGWYMSNYTCYKFFDTPMIFWDAYQYCHGQNAGLVNIYEEEELHLVQQIWNATGHVSANVWIGLYSDSNMWYWSERLGGDIYFIETANDNLAAFLTLSNHSLRSDYISSAHAFVCEKAAGKLSCPSGWTLFKNKCFKVQTTLVNFTNAVSGCQSLGANLATVENSNEKHILGEMANRTSGQYAYVGLQQMIKRQHMWIDGTIPRFVYIETQEDKDFTKCGVVLMGNIENDELFLDRLDCSINRPYICSKSIDSAGVVNDFSNLPCSTHAFCSNPNLACLGGIENKTVYSPRCSGIACPPPWSFINNKCVYANPGLKLIYEGAAQYCWQNGGNLATVDSILEDTLLLEFLPPGKPSWFIGFYSYPEDYLINIKTKRPAAFPYRKSGTGRGAISLDSLEARGQFKVTGVQVANNFICEKQPVPAAKDVMYYDGCYGEATVLYDRDLPYNVFTDSAMTVEKCVSHCLNNGYKYAGIMTGNTCGCGNNRGNYGKLYDYNMCTIKCVGNITQDCGGNTSNSVYRTSEKICTPGLPRSSTDPRICYTYNHDHLVYYDNRLACLHLGGYAIMPKTPVDEKNIYYQNLLGALSFEDIRNVNTTDTTVWLGLEGGDHQWVDDGQYAEWFNWKDKDYGSFWRWASQADLIRNGTWIVDFHVGGTVKTRTACQVYDYKTSYSGSSLRTQYLDTKKVVLSTKYGNMNTSNFFDFNCLLNRDSCPDGFTVMFWLYLNTTQKNMVLLSTGDCAFKTVIISTGFCIFYDSANNSVMFVHASKSEVSRTEIGVNLQTWTHLMVHFDRNESIRLYVDGEFKSVLIGQNTPRIIPVFQSYVSIYSSDNNMQIKNVSFLAAPPDQALLLEIKGRSIKDLNNNVDNDETWKTFQPWSVESNIWNSPGVDGNGFIIPYKSFIHHVGKYLLNSTCINFQDCWKNGKTFAMWVKLSSNIIEPTNIFSFGNKFKQGSGLWFYYNPTTRRITVMFNTLNKYALEFDVNTGEWIHIVLVVLQPINPKVYVNGSLVGTMSSMGVTPDATVTNSPRYFGTVMCPPGWVQFGASCYKYTDQYLKFWEHEHICEAVGGHLVSIDDETELYFVEDLLYNTPVPVYLGVYNFHMWYPNNPTNWITTDGQRQKYMFFNQSSASNAFGYIAITCNPDCGMAQRHSLDENNVNFTGYGGLCEISQKPFSSRREDVVRCPSGWWFWEEHCYLFTNDTLHVGTDAHLFCALHRAIVIEIDSEKEQRFISNLLYRESPLPKTALIGLRLFDNSTRQFVHGDLLPLKYHNWKSTPLNDTNIGCTVIDCSDRTCDWRDISCSESWPVLCEKSAKTQCSPGWEEFMDKCISIQNLPAMCSSVGANLMTFNTEAEVQEFIVRFNLGCYQDLSAGENVNFTEPLDVNTCMTDGILNAGKYIWNSTLEPTYFTDQILTGSGNCVGISTSGLQRIDCIVYTCSICQHYQHSDVSIDNIHFMDKSISGSDVSNLYQTEKFYPETYEFDMTSFSLPQRSVYGVKSDNSILTLWSNNNITVTYDPVIGPVLQATNATSSIVYNVSENDDCIKSLENCHHSFAVSFWLYVTSVSDCVIIDTVGDGTTGMVVSISNNGTRILATVHELNYKTQSSVGIPLKKEWNHINVVWQKYVGLKMFINFHLVEIVSPVDRTMSFSSPPAAVNTSYVVVANCSHGLDTNLRIKHLMFGTNLKEDWENKLTDDIPRFIDFNEPTEKSVTNVNVKMNVSLVETYWRNSLFITAAKIDNPLGLTPAIEVTEQFFMCFSNNDACTRPFTLSLWLYPRNFLQNQIFMRSGIKSHSVGEIESTKIWYDTATDKYFMSLYYDKTKITFDFYIYLYEWSHIVLSADFSKHSVHMYINSVEVTSKTVAFVQDRVIPVYRNSFLRIGDLGTFDIDDLKFLPYTAVPSQMYVLKSCHEFMLAGIAGVKNETIDYDTLDGIENLTITECNLDLKYQGFLFAMEMNQSNIITNSIGINASLVPLEVGSVTHIPVIHNDGALVNQSGLNLTGIEEIKCFSDVKYCFFGFTFSAWIKIIDVSPNTGELTLLELGGNVNNNENGVGLSCVNSTEITTLNCTAVVLNGTNKWMLNFSVLKNQLLHLTLSWNPHINLVVALNGHSTAEFGRLTQHSVIADSILPTKSRPITIGYSTYDPGNLGEFVIDELTIIDNYLEDIQIKQLFGTKHECPYGWFYSTVSDKCYYVSSVTKTYNNAIIDCNAMNAALVKIPDVQTRTWIYNFLDSQFILTPKLVTFGLTQLPRGASSFPIRQPNGKIPDFPDKNLLTVTDFINPQCVRANRALGYWRWEVVRCDSAHYYICEKQPMYVKESPWYVNSSTLFDEGVHLNGQVTIARGATWNSMMFHESHIHMVYADCCLSNFDYCHNGLCIQFWMMTIGPVSSRQIIYSSMMSPESHGVTLYVTKTTNQFLFVIDIRNKITFNSTAVSVSSNVWTYISACISPNSEISIYVNGEIATPITSNMNFTGSSIRNFGVSTEVTIGSGRNGSDTAFVMLDNVTVTESNVVTQVLLKQQVYDTFPRFHTPFDDPKVRTPMNAANTSTWSAEGYFGNALYFNATFPNALDFIGQFAYDCFGSQNMCPEGFTMFIWLKPLSYSYNFVLLNAINQNTGIKIDFRLNDFSMTNKFWITIRKGTTIEDHYLFDLTPDVWSHLSITWYSNGTKFFNVNGMPVVSGYTRSVGLVGNLDPVTQLHFGQSLTNTYLVSSSGSGIDELLIAREPFGQADMLKFYENSTFIHTQVNYDFDNETLFVPGVWNNATRIVSGIDYMNLTNSSYLCFSDIDKCVHGFTVRFAFRLVEELDVDQIIMSAGKDNPYGALFEIAYTAMNQSLPFRRYFKINVRTSSMVYTTWFNMQYNVWSNVLITWHPIFGIRVFVDGSLAVCNSSVQNPRVVSPTVVQPNLIIGQVPISGIELGIFDVEGLVLLDVAMFEDDVIHNGENLWTHDIHRIPIDEVFLQYTDLTRDECHQNCINNNCQSYAFCNNEYFGTCNLFYNSTKNISSSTSCDVFTLYTFNTFPVQDAGCLLNMSAITHSVVLPPELDCYQYCKNMSFVFSFNISSTCYCGDSDLELSIFQSKNQTLKQECLTGHVIQQTTGLRNFIQPSVITFFNVTAPYGTFVLINGTLELDFYVNIGTFAGYRINPGDGRNIFYTSYNNTLLTYSTPGVFVVEIVAMNEVSCRTLLISIAVFEPIEGVLINHTEIVSTNVDVTFIVTVVKGTEVTCHLDYGDGYSDSLFMPNTSLPFLFTHRFVNEQYNDVNITCYNNMSMATNSSWVIPMYPIVNFTMTTPYSVVFGDDIPLNLSMSLGSNVSVEVLVNGFSIFSDFFQNTSQSLYYGISKSVYNETGIHLLNVTAQNPVSGPFNLTGVVHVDIAIYNASLNFSQYVPTSQNTSFRLFIEKGSNVLVFITYGDNSNDTVFLDDDIMVTDLEYNFYHQYSDPGIYTITCFMSNSVSNLTINEIIYVEIVVNDIIFQATGVEDPIEFANITFVILDNLRPPTNALVNVSLGNGEILENIPVIFSGYSFTVLYNYTLNGIFNLTVTVWNNVSSIYFTDILMVGRPISNLTAIPNSFYIAVGDILILSLNVNGGSQISYMVDFDDGTVNSTGNIFTYPAAAHSFQKSFSYAGIYLIDVFANNTFSSMGLNIEIYVQEKLQGMVILSRHVGKLNYPIQYTISLNVAGTNSCFYFDFVNRTELVGGYHCLTKPEYSGLNYTYGEGTLITFTLEFNEPGVYYMNVNGSNEVSYEVFTKKFVILEFPCSYPEVTIYGLSTKYLNPTNAYASDNLIIRAVSDTYCDPLQTVLFNWVITPLDPNSKPLSLEMPTLPYLIIPRDSLEYGKYQINVTVLIQNYLEFNDTATVYINIIASPLELIIKGDNARSVRSGTTLVMDASWSNDPDYPITGIQFNLTWYCWLPTTPFTEFNLNTATLYDIGSPSCFPTLNMVNVNWTILTIPSALLNPINYFVARMSSGDRVVAKAQKVEILAANLPELILRCMENCQDAVSSALPVRFKGQCQTCTQNNRLGIQYNWRLFKIEPGADIEILNLAQWTKTGINGPNLMIDSGYLEAGSNYYVRLESGAAYTIKNIHVSLPPYNGACSSNLGRGVAFQTKFMFSCGSWLDEGNRPARNVTEDKMYLYSYTYTFFYNVIGTAARIPFFQVVTTTATTPGTVLPPGKAEHDYKVKIFIDIVDRDNSTTTVSFDIQVSDFLEDSGHDVLQGFETNVCLRERDMSCILTFCDGLSAINSTNPKDKQLDDEILAMVFDNKNLIQDGLHLAQTTNILSKLTDKSEQLQPKSQDKLRATFTNLVSSAQTGLSNILSVAEKERFATELLTSVTVFCQKTKYDPKCPSGTCTQELITGNFAIDMIELVHNLTGLVLMGNVAGESSTTIKIPIGNVKYQAQRKESLNLVNSTLQIGNTTSIQTRLLPPDITDLETVDVEIMTSDNLYTTHQSVTSIKSQIITFELLKDGGAKLELSNLSSFIDIYLYPAGLDDLNFTLVNLSATTDSSMFFVQLRLNETNVIPVLVVRPDDVNANITYYLRKGNLPTVYDYDKRGSVLESEFEESTGNYIVRLEISDLWSTADVLPNYLYVGLIADYSKYITDGEKGNVTELSPMANISLYVLGCYYWSLHDRLWSPQGLQVAAVSNTTFATCGTSHLSSFGVNMFVPPNTIDFTTVWSKFSADNLAVLVTVGLVLVAYFVLLVPVIRADRRDFKKWAIYPLSDNVTSDVYHYQVSVYTGIGQNAGTTSKIYFVMGGDEGDTEVRLLQDVNKRPMLRGSVNNYLLSVPESLGNLLFLRIWLDNTEMMKIDDWLLNMILVRDVQTDERYAFLCNKWFALDKGEGQIDHLIPVASPEEMQSFGHLFFSKTRKDLTDGHLWFSVMSRPMHSTFTRAQRLSCCLSLLFMTMITNCMWYKTDTNDGDISQNVHLGPFSFSSQEFFTSLMGSLIVVPFNLIIVTLFRKSKPRRVGSSYRVGKKEEDINTSKIQKERIDNTDREKDCTSPSQIDLFQPSNHVGIGNKIESEAQPTTEQTNASSIRKRKSKYPLPHWCRYVAWFLLALSILASGFFTVLYSIEWGSSKSSKWLTSFLLSFVQSIILVQPLKVIMLAIVIALLFKTADEDDSVEEVFVIGESTKTTIYPEHRQEFVSNPMDSNKICEAKDYRNKMNRLFDTMRTILIYVVYLCVVAVLAYENRDVNSFPTYKNLQNIFVDAQSANSKSFSTLQTTKDFYTWMEKIMLPGLYSNGWYNDSVTELSPFISDNTFYRLGSVRMRQARIRNEDCRTPDELRDYINDCYPNYETTTYESRNFVENWTMETTNATDEAWTYKDTLELNGLPTVGQYASYSGGGYVVSLGTDINTAENVINYLENTRWIDRKTRAVFVECNLFNANVNLFCSVILLLEYPPSGSVFPYWEINPIVMYRYVGPSAIFVLVFDIIFAAFTMYYLFDFVRQIRTKGWKEYFCGFWQIIDFANLVLSLVCCAFYGVHFVITTLTLNTFNANRDKFINLQRIVLWEQLFGIILGFVLFLSMLKTLQLIRFNAKVTQLFGTLKKLTKPLANYMVVFLTCFVAFASWGYLLFGRHDIEYSSFIRTTETLMSMLMMKLNIDSMLIVGGILGSCYIFVFVVCVIFVLLNMLLSLINEAFAAVRGDPSYQSDDPQMVDFLIQQLKRMIWGTTECKQERQPEDLIYKMDRLEKRMDKYFLNFLQENKRYNY